MSLNTLILGLRRTFAPIWGPQFINYLCAAYYLTSAPHIHASCCANYYLRLCRAFPNKRRPIWTPIRTAQLFIYVCVAHLGLERPRPPSVLRKKRSNPDPAGAGRLYTGYNHSKTHYKWRFSRISSKMCD